MPATVPSLVANNWRMLDEILSRLLHFVVVIPPPLLLLWRFGHFSGYGLPVAGVLRHYYARGEGRPHTRPHLEAMLCLVDTFYRDLLIGTELCDNTSPQFNGRRAESWAVVGNYYYNALAHACAFEVSNLRRVHSLPQYILWKLPLYFLCRDNWWHHSLLLNAVPRNKALMMPAAVCRRELLSMLYGHLWMTVVAVYGIPW